MPRVRVRKQTIANTVEYLNSIGLDIMGPNCDPKTGEQFPGQRCFNAEQVLEYRDCVEKRGGLWIDEDGTL